jgi:hypothetical protein
VVRRVRKVREAVVKLVVHVASVRVAHVPKYTHAGSKVHT